jgi:hypothetical protein
LIADTTYRVHARPFQRSGPALHVRGDVQVGSGETLDLGAYTQMNEYEFRFVSEASGEPGAE